MEVACTVVSIKGTDCTRRIWTLSLTCSSTSVMGHVALSRCHFRVRTTKTTETQYIPYSAPPSCRPSRPAESPPHVLPGDLPLTLCWASWGQASGGTLADGSTANMLLQECDLPVLCLHQLEGTVLLQAECGKLPVLVCRSQTATWLPATLAALWTLIPRKPELQLP